MEPDFRSRCSCGAVEYLGILYNWFRKYGVERNSPLHSAPQSYFLNEISMPFFVLETQYKGIGQSTIVFNTTIRKVFSSLGNFFTALKSTPDI